MPATAEHEATRRQSGGRIVEPMEARLVEELPDEAGWQFEPKWDGFRCIAYRSGAEVDLRAKSGKPLGRYFPEMVEAVAALPGGDFVLDGELVIPSGGTLSFDALQMRLHPAESRVKKLSRETPALYVLFDMLVAPGGKDIMQEPLTKRRAALEAFFDGIAGNDRFRLSPVTADRGQAEAWLKRGGGALDGVVAKACDGAYEAGERAMLKVKRLRTADCVVGGFRYASKGHEVGSLLLGLYDDEGLLHHVGYTSTIRNEERAELTKRLEKLKGPPGFTGRAPGGPSRWSTERSGEWEKLPHELVVEVRYDQVTGERFRHGTKLLRWRPDKAPRQCTFEQIAQAKRPGKLIGTVIGGADGEG